MSKSFVNGTVMRTQQSTSSRSLLLNERPQDMENRRAKGTILLFPQKWNKNLLCTFIKKLYDPNEGLTEAQRTKSATLGCHPCTCLRETGNPMRRSDAALPDGKLQQLLYALWVEVLKAVNPLQALMQELLGRIFMWCNTGRDGGGHQLSAWQLSKKKHMQTDKKNTGK